MAEKDYKHVLQDMTNLYVGGKLSYKELMDIDEIPFKLKIILSRYITKEVDENTTIENHLFYMKKTDMSYMILSKIRARFRLYVFDESKESYVGKEYKIDEIIDDDYLHAHKNTIFVEEMHIHKINLLSVS